MTRFALAVGLMGLLASSAAADPDLTKLDRTIRKEPEYRTKSPRYCLLVFGPNADTHVWLVLDLAYDPLREKPGTAEALYADLNGDGHLTGTGERIPAVVVSRKKPAGHIGTLAYPSPSNTSPGSPSAT